MNTDYKSVRGEKFTFSNVLEKFCFLCFMFHGMPDVGVMCKLGSDNYYAGIILGIML